MTPRADLIVAAAGTLGGAVSVGMQASTTLRQPTELNFALLALMSIILAWDIRILVANLRRWLVDEVGKAIASRRVWDGREWVRP